MSLTRKHPAECFIKYLISADPGASPESIEAVLSLYNIFHADAEYIRRVRSEMGDIPEPERLAKPDRGSLRWMRKHQIAQLWTSKEVRHGVTAILENIRVKGLVERMLISGYFPSEIESFLTLATATDIQNYRHYVFNLESLSPDELTEFLIAQGRLYLNLWTNRGPDAKQYLLHHEGLAPVEATIETVGTRIVRLVNDRIFQLSSERPSVEDSRVLKNYSGALANAAGVLGSGSDAVTEFRKVIDKLHLNPEDDGIVTFDDLTNPDWKGEVDELQPVSGESAPRGHGQNPG